MTETYQTPNEWKCPLCSKEMGDERIPKLFNCGCTVCESCVDEKVDENNHDGLLFNGYVYCPECDEEQRGNDSGDVAINKKLLKLILETKNKLGNLSPDAKKMLTTLKNDKVEEFLNCEASRKKYVKKATEAKKAIDAFMKKVDTNTNNVESSLELLKEHRADVFYETKAYPLNDQLVKLSRVLDDVIGNVGELQKKFDTDHIQDFTEDLQLDSEPPVKRVKE